MSRAIEQKINLALTRMGLDIFEKSQERVPVSTGRLKRNSLVRLNKNMVEIRYDMPYARRVEFGSEGESASTVHTSTVAPHIRTTSTGRRVRVQGHTKTYTGFKPIKCADGRWAVIDVSKPYKGRFYLSGAVKEVLINSLGKSMGLQTYIR